MNGAAKLGLKISEVSQRFVKAKGKNEAGANTFIRLYVDSASLLDRILSACAGETDLEVHGEWTVAELKMKRTEKTLAVSRVEVLVTSSSGALQEDLRRIHKSKAEAPELKVLLFGSSQSEPELLQYLRAGISGFLPGEASAEEIIAAARAVGNGQAICTGVQCAILFRYFEKEAEAFPSAALHRELGLTRREQQLIPLLTRGLTNKEIANHFSLSEQTVKNHLYRMKRKIGAAGRLEIVDVCRQHGFLV
ncbi:MAG TPA: LuxR C-terminal-related transcriptional regulator [Candidatus Dormibacteraeota bacterium]|jgi:DNA-binding NarL/FixJ family response regulator|nr:LuxR C-terminal-related transcriptional regulator [Candidatus Dormibacteraeota bacterium]